MDFLRFPVVLLGLVLSAGQGLYAAQEDPYLAARQAMVGDQIQREGISDPRVLQAMREVPRHLFVP